jgi:predicted ATPase
MAQLKSLALSGWKSIKQTEIDLGPLNVLVGANGSGKSNLISFFKLLNEMIGDRLQEYVAVSGGAKSLLYYGPKVTPFVEADLRFVTESGESSYFLRLAHAAVDTIIFTEERLTFQRPGFLKPRVEQLGAGHRETQLRGMNQSENQTVRVLRAIVSSCRLFHFHDTSLTAAVRLPGYIEENRHLRPDAGNLAALLRRQRLQAPAVYDRIVRTIRQINPLFGDFVLEPQTLNPNEIVLNWREKGKDLLFGPHQISDGTLRAMALVTLLLQREEELPDLIVIDEPELGLHPYAIEVIASLFRKASHHCQVIISTQSPQLLDYFEASEIIVVNRPEETSEYSRLSEEQLASWLEEYDLGELWEKNVLGGGPH